VLDDEVVEPGDEADPDHQRQQREVARLREEPRKELCVLGDVLGGDDRGALGAEYPNTSTYATFAAMKLSMIVVITSLASVYAFSAPGIAPQKPPPTAPARTPATISATPATGPPGGAASGRREHGQCGRKTPDDQLALCPDVEQPGGTRPRRRAR